MANVHATAIVSSGAEIGRGVTVGPYALIGPKVVLADDVIVGGHALVEGRTRIGKGTEIHPFASIGIRPQDLKYNGEDTELIIGERNQIREYVNISIGTAGGGGKTVIGNDNLIMVYCHVAHDCVLGDGIIMANAVALAGHVEVQNRAVVGGVAAVHQFTRIGEMSMVAGGSMVAQDVPPFSMVHGDRAVPNGLNVVGLRRTGWPQERLANIRSMYRLLYQDNLTMDDAMARIEAEIPDSDQKKVFLGFLRGSTRGVCR